MKHRKTGLVLSGELRLPKGITAAKYRGTITITASRGRKTLAKTTGKLSLKTGKYSITLGHRTAATSITVKFSGNTMLFASTRKTTLA